MLYDLIVGPLEFLIAKVYNLGGLVALSIFVNLLTDPLYRKAEQMQTRAAAQKEKAAAWVRHIKKTFQGEEKVFLLQAYYRESGYNPMLQIKGMASLLIQIPFFMAAYHYLSAPDRFRIVAMNQPDAFLQFAGRTIHLLPLLMTAICLLAGFLYLDGKKFRDNWTVIVLPLVFCVLLYNSPSGLVIYWILNNTVALLRNQISKYCKKHDKSILVLLMMLALALAFGFRYAIGFRMQGRIMLEGVLVTAGFAGIMYGCRRLFRKRDESMSRLWRFELKLLFIVLFWALYLPLSLIASATGDFYQMGDETIWKFLQHPVLYSIGLLFLWGNLTVYLCFRNKLDQINGPLLFFCFFMVISHMFWDNDCGMMDKALRYMDGYPASIGKILISMLIFAVLYIFWTLTQHRIRKHEGFLLAVMLCSVSAGIIYHGVAVHRNADHIRELAGRLETKQESTPIKLSRTGKNVIVVMLDREVGAFFPYALEDMPYLREQYDGFTYYANSLSTGTTTTTGSPGLFGGHEYCGDAMMTDTGVPLAERHNEALKVLPVLFWQNGYHCIVAGLPFANYSDFPDMSIFDEYPDMDTYVFERELSMDRMTVDSEWNISSALFSYAIFKSAPYFYHDFLYNTVCYGLEQIPIEIPLEESYSVLANLPQMTVAVDEECGSFVEFDNNLVHEPALLQLPDYTITEKIDNTEYWAAMEDLSPMLRKLKTQGQYHVGAAALRLMGQWMDHLRELGVYDNTRIIIVSDHGANNLDFYPAVWGSDIGISNWDCILLYKDFNASGLTVCEDFMCNADVPYLATLGGVVKEAVNPFTGKPFTTAAMQNNTVTAVLPLEWAPVKGNAFTGYVYTVKEDMREAGNWQLMEQRY